MYLTRHRTPAGYRWALDSRYLPESFTLSFLLDLPAGSVERVLRALPTGDEARDPLAAPIEPYQEVWASGVTYRRSREARMAESGVADVYDRVYVASRPELFFKAHGWRVRGHREPVRIRRDSGWNVPEPELTLVLDRRMEIVGYTAGDDVSSRDIEGENPLYLPQAKVYDGSCALGPGILLTPPEEMRDLPIRLRIERAGGPVFEEETSTAQMKRSFEDLAEYLGRELELPSGALLMTGTGIVPGDDFTLEVGDLVHVTVGELVLTNEVSR